MVGCKMVLGRSVLVAALAALAGALGAAGPQPEAAFVAENNRAMDRMMFAMDTPSTGDADRDFVAMMVPHHQGAIDMAKTELRYGRNEQLKRLAQEIIIAQGQEITVMRQAVGEPSPTQAGSR